MKARTPPQLHGFTFLRTIGSGGFADVHLYQQELPARQVAVKVLRGSADKQGLAMFHAEANVMAQLSGHPSIVTIHLADVAADGRPYLVMEYCPPPHLSERFRTERIPVPEVLDVAVRIASAMETAHRAGILHRDIKPHNILTSAYGAAQLTDFGIASVADQGHYGQGLSIPWSPPEVFEGTAPPDVRSDVYSLAATVYSLLAGRSPFEIPGAANDSSTLMHRIEHFDPTPVLRPDVPEALNDLLVRSLSSNPENRPASGMAFARAIQDVQVGLHLTPTRLEVIDASPDSGARGVVNDGRTEIRPISIIVPDEIVERQTLLRPVSIPQESTGRHPARATQPAGSLAPMASPDTHRGAPEVAVGGTGGFGSFELNPPAEVPAAPAPRAKRWPWVLGALVAAAVAVVVVLALQQPGEEKAPDVGPTTPPEDIIRSSAPTPRDLRIERATGNTVTVSWRNADAEPGDTFRVETGPSVDALTEFSRGPEASVQVPAKKGDLLCLAVSLIRQGSGSSPLEKCVVAP